MLRGNTVAAAAASAPNASDRRVIGGAILSLEADRNVSVGSSGGWRMTFLLVCFGRLSFAACQFVGVDGVCSCSLALGALAVSAAID
jgi:hypothetical protein